jgi:hypothetical protein
VDEKIEVLRAAAPLLLTQRGKGCVRSEISSTTFDNSSELAPAEGVIAFADFGG